MVTREEPVSQIITELVAQAESALRMR